MCEIEHKNLVVFVFRIEQDYDLKNEIKVQTKLTDDLTYLINKQFQDFLQNGAL